MTLQPKHTAPVSAFMGLLSSQAFPSQNVFNPWNDYDPIHDGGGLAPTHRRENLRVYLEERIGKAKILLIAEAPGYQGCKFSGIAMTSERILMGGLERKGVSPRAVHNQTPHPRTSNVDVGPQSRRTRGYAEPTATIVWTRLLALGLNPRDFVLWNAFAWHPHDAADYLSNRRPEPQELEQGKDTLKAMLGLFPGVATIAVGRVAEGCLQTMGIAGAFHVPHPANGGANDFANGIKGWLSANPNRNR